MHLDDEAELYALGMLDDAERARVDDHVRTCDVCVQRIGAAEAAVAALIDATQRVPQRRRARWPLAVAATFAIAAAGLLGRNALLHGELDRDGALFATLVNAHFDHEQFTSPRGTPIGAKAIFERHGAWFEVLVDGTPAWNVTFVRRDGSHDHALAHFVRRGTSEVLIALPPAPVSTIELEDAAGRIVGVVHPKLLPP
jgi:hypothetical protein